MIAEYRHRALTERGLPWPIRLRLLLLVRGNHRWNAWLRDLTARMEGHKNYDAEVTIGGEGL